MPNKPKSKHAHIEPQMRLQPIAGSTDTHELLVYGDIGDSWWGESVTAQSVVQQLNELDNTIAKLNVRINSYGGSVADGLAIFNALKRHPATKAVTIDGVAMSSASLIAMAGDTVHMPATSILMIHAPWGGIMGNAKELRKYADVLDTFSDAMADAYVAKSGKPRADVLALLKDGDDHYYTGEEALAEGFADAVNEDEDREDVPGENARAFASALTQRYLGRASAHYAQMAIAAALRSTHTTTTPKEKEMPKSTDPVAAANDALRTRNNEINIRAAAFIGNPNVRDYTLRALADPDVTVDEFSKHVMDMIGRDTTSVAGSHRESDAQLRVSGGAAAGHDFVEAASDSLAIRAGIKIENPHAGVRDVHGMGLTDIARACVHRSGRSVDGSKPKGAIIKAALSTSDFPAILENTLGKALRGGFEAEPATHDAWTRKVLVPDFKPQSRVILGSAPALLPVLEGAEYTYGSMDEDKSVPYSVGKFGRLLQFTWEALSNDDLGAFLRTTQAMGQAAARAEADSIYATFGLNSGDGPTMQDSVNLFHATHNNLAASATSIDATALGAARVLLRRQTALGGGVLNLTPRFLLIAPEHEQNAEALLAAAARTLSQGSNNQLVPAWLAKLELVVEARLPATAFYLLTSPDSVDTLERAWIDEDNGPRIFEEDSFTVDAKSYKVRFAFGNRWLDWRGAVKVPISG